MNRLPTAWAVKIDATKEWPSGQRWMRHSSYAQLLDWASEIHRAEKFTTRTGAENSAATLVMKHPDLIGKVHIVKIVAKVPDAHGIGMHGGWTEAKYVRRHNKRRSL